MSDAQAHRFREKSVSSVYWPLSYEGSRPTPILGSQASFTGCPIELLATGRAMQPFIFQGVKKSCFEKEGESIIAVLLLCSTAMD